MLMDKTIDTSIEFYKDLTKDFTIVEKLWDLFDATPTIK